MDEEEKEGPCFGSVIQSTATADPRSSNYVIFALGSIELCTFNFNP